jgi:hypothetical protein
MTPLDSRTERIGPRRGFRIVYAVFPTVAGQVPGGAGPNAEARVSPLATARSDARRAPKGASRRSRPRCSERTVWTTPGTARGYTPRVSHPRAAVCALGIALPRVTRTGLRRPCAVGPRLRRIRRFRFPRRTPLRNPTKVSNVFPPCRPRNAGRAFARPFCLLSAVTCLLGSPLSGNDGFLDRPESRCVETEEVDSGRENAGGDPGFVSTR